MSLVIVLLPVTGVFAQVPAGWQTNPPRDTATTKYSMGISAPEPSEQAAVKSAWQNALQNLASSIGTNVASQADITAQSEGFDSGIEDVFTVRLENSTFSTQVRLTGVREMDRKLEKEGASFKAYILAAISVEDWNKALRYIENEESAGLAYRFFAQKVRGITPLNRAGKPQSAGTSLPAETKFPYDDYYGWLRSECITISVTGDNGAAYSELINQFSKKLYRNSVVFSSFIDQLPSRILYDSARYYDGVLRALSNTGIFTVSQENGAIILTPKNPSSLAAFKKYVDDLKDSSKVVVTGIEVIETADSRVVNSGSLVINQFKLLAAKQFGLTAVNFTIPQHYLSEPPDEDAIIGYIRQNIAAFPARFLAICVTETRLESGIPEYKIPPNIVAQTQFLLYDLITGERIDSETADTKGFVFSPSNQAEASVVSESRKAIQFLFNAKNRPGLEGIMRKALE
jgi:hypothetical protein